MDWRRVFCWLNYPKHRDTEFDVGKTKEVTAKIVFCLIGYDLVDFLFVLKFLGNVGYVVALFVFSCWDFIPSMQVADSIESSESLSPQVFRKNLVVWFIIGKCTFQYLQILLEVLHLKAQNSYEKAIYKSK